MSKSVSKLSMVFEIVKIIKSGKNIGDAAALKLTLLNASEASSALTDLVLEQKKETFRFLRVEDLKSKDPLSFGFHYSQFMLKNKLKPLNFSENSLDLFDKHPISMRYIRLHDMIHVLLGFDPSPAGELGVYVFISEQKYTKALDKAARTAQRISRLMFWKYKEMSEASRRGKHLAHGAAVLVAQPLESLLDESLEDIRRELVPAYFD